MRLVTKDDFIDLYSKLHQRGIGYILSKFTFNQAKRTTSTFNKTNYPHANWWIIPEVRKRWNTKISGNPDINYEDYIVGEYLKGKNNLKLLSLGSGSCSHELNFARHRCFSEVKCIDLSPNLLNEAMVIAQKEGLKNMVFEIANVNKTSLSPEFYDIILFHSSLHHFKNMQELLGTKVYKALKNDGLLITNEYVGPNRLQWAKHQLFEINRILKDVLPDDKKQRLAKGLKKRSVSGPGILRMLVTDPSEAIESESIIPAIRSHFNTLEEKPLGGNILMPLLKDISHNFVEETEENKQLLNLLFTLEDDFLKLEKSNLVFGVYQKKTPIS